MEAKTQMSELWGGPLGKKMVPATEATAATTNLKDITINYNAHALCTLRVNYENANGGLDSYGPWGGNPKSGKWEEDKIHFQNGEILVSIEGTYDWAEGVRAITSLTLKTNKRQKTIGHVKGTKFSFEQPNVKIVGFYGHFGAYIDAIGIYLAPSN